MEEWQNHVLGKPVPLEEEPRNKLTEFVNEWARRAAQVQKDHKENHHEVEVVRIEPLPMPPPLKIFFMDTHKEIEEEIRKMEKHGVEKDESKTKTASAISGRCPDCGIELSKEDGAFIDHCPVCGTKPFEKRPPAADTDPSS